MAEPRSEVGISNREAPEDEARERREHPAQLEGDPAEPNPDEAKPREIQTSGKIGIKATAQKDATARHTEGTAPPAAKVQGAFGKERD